ncbi:MAG: bifunctional oligoribonuclease/PAP phosphatase NrnA [Patescibacteria group bacterium]|nr:bifunctional oligoribonuclease/PAP phosphatase NrnA [Patescibacteria group bacterium]MDD5490878.1 bifunctional oligoribonuclease/PAP phosphatase NrnA [Patescibacteria group bacterium]
MNYETLQGKFFNLINAASRILVVSHQRPDGDTLGANFALCLFLESLNKVFSSFCLHPLPAQFNFLPFSHKLKNDIEIFAGGADLIIILDSGDLRYAGIEEQIKNLKTKAVIVNIDHHPTNENFGDLNIVNPGASSTTEILFYLFEVGRIPISRPMATCLLTGILTDTSNFSNPATTADSLNVAAKLLSSGVILGEILPHILKNKSVAGLKVWGEVLSRLKITANGLAVTFVTRRDIEENSIDEEAVSGISNFLNNLSGVKAAMFIKEELGGQLRINLRTSHDDVDVSRLAKFFGGGGHKKAAGFAIKGSLKEKDDGEWEIV